MICAAAGTFLVLTSVLWVILRIAWDIAAADLPKPIGKPGVYGLGVTVFIGALPILLPAAIIGLPSALATCVSRCRDGLLGTIAWLLALVALLAIILVRELRMFVPCIAVAAVSHSAVASYVGAALQIAAGGFLLGRLGRKRAGNL